MGIFDKLLKNSGVGKQITELTEAAKAFEKLSPEAQKAVLNAGSEISTNEPLTKEEFNTRTEQKKAVQKKAFDSLLKPKQTLTAPTVESEVSKLFSAVKPKIAEATRAPLTFLGKVIVNSKVKTTPSADKLEEIYKGAAENVPIPEVTGDAAGKLSTMLPDNRGEGIRQILRRSAELNSVLSTKKELQQDKIEAEKKVQREKLVMRATAKRLNGEQLTNEEKLAQQEFYDEQASMLLGANEAPIKLASELGSVVKSTGILSKLLGKSKTAAKEIDTVEKALANTDQLAKMAGNINLSKINNIDDAKKLIADTAKRMKPAIDKQTRGVVPIEETKRLAAELGTTPKKLIKATGKAYNAEEVYAIKSVLGTQAEEVVNLLKKIQAPDGNSEAALLQFREAFARHGEIQKAAAGAASESGRALRIQRELTGSIPTEQSAIKAMHDALGGRGVTDEIVKRMSKIDLTDPMAVNKFIRDYTKVSTGDKIYEVWVNNILSNPTTQIVNAVGNTAQSLLQPAIRTVDAGINLLRGKNREVFFGEVPHQVYGAVAGIKEGMKRALFVLKKGMSLEQASQIGMDAVPAIKGKLGGLIRTPTKLLGAADEFFKTINGTAELHAQAFRKATLEKLRGNAFKKRVAELLQSPTDDMLKHINDFKLETTFQSPLGVLGEGVMSLRRKVPGLRYIMPFVKTPMNIGKEALKLSPLGFLDTAFKIGTKKPTTEITKSASKALIGSMITVYTATQVLDGNITGTAPRDQREKDAFYRQGKQPYSVKIGDKWYSYRRIEPLASIVGGVADVVDLVKDGKDNDAAKIGAALLSLAGSNLNDKTFLQGLSNMVNALSDPARYGSNWIETTATGAVPATGVMNFIRNQTDPVVRKVDSPLDAIKNRIPGLSSTLTPTRDALGGIIKKETGVLPALGINTKDAMPKNKALEDELEKHDILLGFPSAKITIYTDPNNKKATEKVELSGNQYDFYLKTIGEARARIGTIIQSKEYKELSEPAQKAVLEKLIRAVDDQVRENISLQLSIRRIKKGK